LWKIGINKPDVRLVIHYGMTKSIEAYYQQTGRAGRDGLPARCILLFNRQDVVKSFNVAARDMNMQSVASSSVALAAAALMEEGRAAIVPPTIELSFEDHVKQDPLQRLKFQLQCMKEYATGCGQYHCRRRYLLRYFGEDIAVHINGSEGGNSSSSCCDLCDMRGSINTGSYSDPPRDGSKQSNIHDIRGTSSGGIAIDASDMIDVSYEVYMLLSTIIDSGEVYGINVPLSILMGKHDKSVQRVHGYEGLRYFNAGTIHSVDWWKALTNQLVEVDRYVDTILMKSTNNGGYSYQKYVVSTQGRLYLAGLTSAQYEVNKRNGYHYIPTELFDEQKHKYECSFVSTALRSMIDLEMKTKRPSSSVTQKQQSIRNTSSSASKHLSLSDTANSSSNRIFKFVSLQMAFDPQKVMNHHHHHRPQPSHLDRDASIQSEEPSNNQRVKQNQSMGAKLRSALYQELRQLRHMMAEQKKINPYDIIGAPELERLVALDPLPTTPQDLSRVPGFSDWKIRSFGSELIHVILSFQERHADDYKALQALSSKDSCKDSSRPIYLVASERVVTPPVRPTVKLFHPSYDDTNINAASPICNLIDKRKAVDVPVPTQNVVDEVEGDFLTLLAKNEELLMRSESKVVRIDAGTICCIAETNNNATPTPHVHNENTNTNIEETSMNSCRVVVVEPHTVNSSNPYQSDRDHVPTATSSITSSTAINAVSTGSNLKTHKPSDNAWRKRQGMISGLSAYKARKDPKLTRAPTV
jgi:superfamily II DNA helicase RecQ